MVRGDPYLLLIIDVMMPGNVHSFGRLHGGASMWRRWWRGTVVSGTPPTGGGSLSLSSLARAK